MHTQLPKHLRPEAESWKPLGHSQMKLPSVLMHFPNVQISDDWVHSLISDTQRETVSLIMKTVSKFPIVFPELPSSARKMSYHSVIVNPNGIRQNVISLIDR